MTGRLITVAPTVLFVADLAAIGVWAIVRSIRSGRRRSHRDRAADLRMQCIDPPAIDTQPGTSQQLLDHCNAIYDADTRRENP